MLQRVMSRFAFELFCLTVPKIFVEEPFCAVFQKISGVEKFMDKRGVGSIKIFRRKFLSHSAEIFRRGILYSCIIFGYRKSLDKRGGGGVSRFSVENFCLTVPKIFVGVSFIVALISGSEKVYG